MNPVGAPDPVGDVNLSIPSLDFGHVIDSSIHWVSVHYPTWVLIGKQIVWFMIGASIPLAIFFIIVIIYSVEGLKRIRKKEAEIYDGAKVEPGFEDAPAQGDAALSKRWESVTGHLSSPNQNDWKQAIMDADIILDDILTKLGYQGESVGEKLKRATKGDFKTLDDAWEAHKIRNSIAHEAGFTLTHHEATHAIGRYKRVFEEFYFI